MSFTSGGDAGVYFDTGMLVFNEYGFPLIKFEDTYLNGNPFNVVPLYGGLPSGPTEAYPAGQFDFIPDLPVDPMCCVIVPTPGPVPDHHTPVPEPAYSLLIMVLAVVAINYLILSKARRGRK